jgi:phosphoribosylamine---glycine ligase
MNILLLGSGGREHAIAWKLSQSNQCTQLFIAPGNAGTSECGKNINLSLANDFAEVKKFCVDTAIDMVVVGPEDPLVKGIVDFFAADVSTAAIPVIGPSAYGAQLEGSKAFAKAFMQRHNIPTAAYKEFSTETYQEGVQYIAKHTLPIVLKADGLAAGKGVLICTNHVEALAEFELMIQQSKFGEASKKVVVEEFLSGIEMSVFALTDGKNYVLLPDAKDYKRIGVADTGLNTGGMGAVSPVPFADDDFMNKVEEQVIKPTINGIYKEQINYTGFVFFGLIKVGENPFVIEYNCRMGDPETEVVMPRLKNDLVTVLKAAAAKKIDTITVECDERYACTVVAVSGGYPGDFEKGFEITGLDYKTPDSLIFHAGTKKAYDAVLTNGGRVFCVTSYGDSVGEAVDKSKEVLKQIRFEDMYYRNDIGYEFL